MRAPTPARLLLLALLCLAAAACGGSGDEPSTAAPATTAGAATTTAPASQACADAAALKASVAELDQIDPPEAGKAGVQAALEKVRTNLAALRTSAASQWGTEVGELDSAVNALVTTVSGIDGEQSAVRAADHRQRPGADRRRLDRPGAADRPGLLTTAWSRPSADDNGSGSACGRRSTDSGRQIRRPVRPASSPVG